MERVVELNRDDIRSLDPEVVLLDRDDVFGPGSRELEERPAPGELLSFRNEFARDSSLAPGAFSQEVPTKKAPTSPMAQRP